MNAELSENLSLAIGQTSNTIQALRDALTGANAIQGDCIGELIREAAELKRKITRLADVIQQDSK